MPPPCRRSGASCRNSCWPLPGCTAPSRPSAAFTRFASPPMNAGCVADRRHPHIGRGAVLLREVAVFDVELHQRLRMLRHEGDRVDHQRALVLGGLQDDGIGRRLHPFQRPDPALVRRPPSRPASGRAARRSPPRRPRPATHRDRRRPRSSWAGRGPRARPAAWRPALPPQPSASLAAPARPRPRRSPARSDSSRPAGSAPTSPGAAPPHPTAGRTKRWLWWRTADRAAAGSPGQARRPSPP